MKLKIGRMDMLEFKGRPVRYLRDLKGLYNMLDKTEDILLDAIETGGNILSLLEEPSEGTEHESEIDRGFDIITVERRGNKIINEDTINIRTKEGQLKLEQDFLERKNEIEKILRKYEDKGNSFKLKKMDDADRIVLNNQIENVGRMLDMIIIVIAGMLGIDKENATDKVMDILYSGWTY